MADWRRRPESGFSRAGGIPHQRQEGLDERPQRTSDTVKRLFLRENQVHPLRRLFEVLYWIDAETQALLDSLLESLPSTRMLLLSNYRPVYDRYSGGKTGSVLVQLLLCYSARALLPLRPGEKYHGCGARTVSPVSECRGGEIRQTGQ
jgi:hypothetical protein